MMRWTLAACLAVSPAFGFELQSPVDCEIGRTCFIQQYVDHDPGPGHTDLTCAKRSYDGHKGTDIRLPDLQSLAEGTKVLAAAAGKVRGARDGMPDIASNAPGAPSIEKRACGNGVLVDHADGWSTQYCHLRKGSVTVKAGQEVAVGDVLGEIGLSGKTEFPHLHLTLRRGETVIDPFTSDAMGADCALPDRSLWSEASGITYMPGGIMSAGMQMAIPDYDEVKRTSPHLARMTPQAPALVFWAHFFGVSKGDVLETKLTGPDGTVIAEKQFVMDRPRATQFRAIGRKKRGQGWAPGIYDGVARLIRDGEPVAERRSTVEVQ